MVKKWFESNTFEENILFICVAVGFLVFSGTALVLYSFLFMISCWGLMLSTLVVLFLVRLLRP